LENIVERSLILSSGTTLMMVELPCAKGSAAAAAPHPSTEADHRTLEQVERDHIVAVCERCRWRISGRGNAAEQLGLNPNTLRSRMQKLGIARPGASREGTGSEAGCQPR
jgi:DNA-binding NtrC family response regulator